MFYTTFHSCTCIVSFITWFISSSHPCSSLFLSVGFNIVSHLVADHLDRLRESRIDAACSQRLWSSLITWPAHLHLLYCAAYEISFICVLFLMSAFLVCVFNAICNILLSSFLWAACSDYFLCPGVNVHVWNNSPLGINPTTESEIEFGTSWSVGKEFNSEPNGRTFWIHMFKCDLNYVPISEVY